MIYFFLIYQSYFSNKNDIPQIFLEQKVLYHQYFQNMKAFSAVNMNHNIITATNPFPYTAKFMFVGIRYNKTEQIIR